MYFCQTEMKTDPARRWALRDRAFFGYGACHILAGVYLRKPPVAGLHAERIIPADGRPGNHIFVTDGIVAFDFHGYVPRARLLRHHARVWSHGYAGWACRVERVTFDLLDTRDLNARKMRGPDQFLHDPVPRAQAFLRRFDHRRLSEAARMRETGLRQAE